MNTTSITIEEGRVIIRQENGGVWLTQHQIADLFEVFVSAVNSNIRSILKNEILKEESVSHTRKNGKDKTVTVYNLEMITALAFRFKSRKAEQYRRWITEQALGPIILWKIPGNDIILN